MACLFCVVKRPSRKMNPPRPRVEEPAPSREAASYMAQGERYFASPGVADILHFFPIQSDLTPLAEVTPSREHGIRRQHCPLCASFDAAHNIGVTLGQGASERGLEEEKK